MRRISKRLEALERASDKEIFGNDFSIAAAIAYYVGGARGPSEVVHGYARALGYEDLDELVEASAYLFCPRLERKGGRAAFEARIQGALRKLLAKFGYDLRRRPAALADAAYRIIRTLPEEWRAMIKSAQRESYEAEARANQLLKEAMKLTEECQLVRHTRRRQGDPRQ
jgi:hypothetical protein